MIVPVAAGMQPNLTWNPAEPAATITAYIVQVALGDLPHGSIGYQTIFAAGLTLMLLTLFFNVLGHFLKRRYRQVYSHSRHDCIPNPGALYQPQPLWPYICAHLAPFSH